MAFIYGTWLDEVFSGTSGNDYIYGNGGSDVIYGGTGKDELWGGDDNDEIFGGDDNDKIWGGADFDTLLGGGRDHYLLLADYGAYVACQERVSDTYRCPDEWTRQSILNVAHMGKFSTDRTIKEYADEIWGLMSVPIEST